LPEPDNEQDYQRDVRRRVWNLFASQNTKNPRLSARGEFCKKSNNFHLPIYMTMFLLHPLFLVGRGPDGLSFFAAPYGNKTIRVEINSTLAKIFTV